MPMFHNDNVRIADALTAIVKVIDLKTQRLQLCLIDSTRYWIAAVIEEWTDAVLIEQDNHRLILLMKQTLQSIEPVPRPVQSKVHADD